jgi:hypothetical protein
VQLSAGASSQGDSDEKLHKTAEVCATEIRLSPAGTFIGDDASAADADELLARRRQLAIAIRQRIESRLVGRVRELAVSIKGNLVILEGKCATYYTKQLAQHAALGALEDESLENAIVVEVPRCK